MIKRLLLSILLLAVTFVAVRCQSSKQFDTVHDEIEHIRQQYGNLGLTVVVVKEGKIVYADDFGYNPDKENPTHGNPIRKDDLFYIASISKTFVGTAIMQLVEQGKLSLDDDVNGYLDFSLRNPQFPDVPITIRMLLCHRSSLRKGAPYDDFDKVNPEKSSDVRALFNDYPPGGKADYSNLGFAILGAVVEKASGLRYDVYVQKNILAPLRLYGGYDVSKLDSTKFVNSCRYNAKKDSFVVQRKAFARKAEKMNQYILGYSTTALRPASGMILSSTDLANYMMMHMADGKGRHGKRVLKKNSERQMREGQNKTVYGLSFVHFLNVIPDEDLIGMNGAGYGTHSAMFFNPDRKFGFVVICNGCKSKTYADSGLNDDVVRFLYDYFIEKQ